MPKRASPQDSEESVKLSKDKEVLDLFVDAPRGNDENDSESEESEYSGLEDELSSSGQDDDSDMDGSFDESDDDDESDNESDVEKTETNPQDDAETSDEEDVRNTIGNVPIEWYNDYPHIGYDLDGKQLMKPATGDELDTFLSKMDDPDFWRTVKDKQTMREVVLTDEELEIIDRLQNKNYPQGTDPYEPYVDFITHEKMIHPVSNAPEPKRRFIPSKWEHKRVMKIVRAIRNGWIKPRKTDSEKPQYYMLWEDNDDQVGARHSMHIAAPKMKLPGHDESYNPPPEYLPSAEEIAAWEDMDPEDRPRNFIPKKYSSLRLVPGYNRFIEERFERCLDLYLCPRQRKMRLNVNPEDLIPKLPKPKDLRPFPSVESLIYRGHKGTVYCINVDPSGQWLASGSEDKSVKIWEVSTGRCLKTLPLSGPVQSLAWNPNPSLCLLAVAVEQNVLIINADIGDERTCLASDEIVNNYTPQEDAKELVPWCVVKDEQEKEKGHRLKISHPKDVKQVTWHIKGDYFAAVVSQGGNQSVIVHQLSKRRSQCPFKKAKGLVQCVLFHPSRPFLFVATQSFIRVYNLMKQELTKKLISNVKWISSMAVHPKGDNLIVGSYDKRLCWFDMDLSVKPYKVLRHHKKALRQVTYHPHYPLFASASDDGTVIICHGMVYNDLLQNPLIVPVKVIKGHVTRNDLGVFDCQFHPSQPWIFTAGADHTIRLFT